jgi:hypothetical protein
MGWGILLLAGLTVAWLIVRPEKWWNEVSKTNQISSDKTQKKETEETPSEKKKVDLKPNVNYETSPDETTSASETLDQANKTNKTEDVATSKRNQVTSPDKSPADRRTERVPINKIPDNKNIIPEKDQRNLAQQKPVLRTKGNVKKKPLVVAGEEKKEQKDNTKAPDNSFPITDTPRVSVTEPKVSNKKPDTTLTTANQQTVTPNDSASKRNTDQPRDSAHQKKAKQPQKKMFLVAGIGEQQLIPVAGQTAVPYSRYGRKGSLADYVPSVFMQLQKEKKWFIQGEFRYGAAQSVKEFSYNRKTKFDTFSKNVTVTTMRLKKTYYHQLPLSFNYYLKSNLSVGIGGMYSRF